MFVNVCSFGTMCVYERRVKKPLHGLHFISSICHKQGTYVTIALYSVLFIILQLERIHTIIKTSGFQRNNVYKIFLTLNRTIFTQCFLVKSRGIFNCIWLIYSVGEYVELPLCDFTQWKVKSYYILSNVC